MNILLNDVEVRILGCLIEKEITTPEYYPLTLNALTNACNQKSNRDPVVSYEETTVLRGLTSLQEKGFTSVVSGAGSRVPKYRHRFLDRFDLLGAEVAVMCELMVRGPQTAGELRARCERMHAFGGLDDVEKTLAGLMETEQPFVVKLPRETGRKERRYAHLLSGTPEGEGAGEDELVEPAAPSVESDGERLARLEEEVERLRREVDGLKQAFREFTSQF